jgi:hypothetical protein
MIKSLARLGSRHVTYLDASGSFRVLRSSLHACSALRWLLVLVLVALLMIRTGRRAVESLAASQACLCSCAERQQHLLAACKLEGACSEDRRGRGRVCRSALAMHTKHRTQVELKSRRSRLLGVSSLWGKLDGERGIGERGGWRRSNEEGRSALERAHAQFSGLKVWSCRRLQVEPGDPAGGLGLPISYLLCVASTRDDTRTC